ncbi:MAG: hemerythrin domain-containing protein [Muribaculaceae bacterium]|nr:hemerythrin domain-containing protein [Muribaculaceae bacterium]
MKTTHKYSATDKMCNLICDNYSLLMVLSRFDLPLGFGDKTVQEVCDIHGVHCGTFLAVANFITESDFSFDITRSDISVEAMMKYLKNAHTYFLDFNLPEIRRKLIEAIDFSGNARVSILILQFFDEYAEEVRKHMEYENTHVFSYVEKLLAGKPDSSFKISLYASRHEQIDDKLTELKNIIIKYYPERNNNNLLNNVLFDIFNCEQDLASHCQVEDYLFVPAVSDLELNLDYHE